MEQVSLRRPCQPKRWRLKLVQIENSGVVDSDTERHYKEALYAAVQEFGQEHPDFAEAATYLADLYMFLGRYQEAETLYRKALGIYQRTLGDEHMICSMALRNLAVAVEARGFPDEARQLRYLARGIFG